MDLKDCKPGVRAYREHKRERRYCTILHTYRNGIRDIAITQPDNPRDGLTISNYTRLPKNTLEKYDKNGVAYAYDVKELHLAYVDLLSAVFRAARNGEEINHDDFQRMLTEFEKNM